MSDMLYVLREPKTQKYWDNKARMWGPLDLATQYSGTQKDLAEQFPNRGVWLTLEEAQQRALDTIRDEIAQQVGNCSGKVRNTAIRRILRGIPSDLLVKIWTDGEKQLAAEKAEEESADDSDGDEDMDDDDERPHKKPMKKTPNF